MMSKDASRRLRMRPAIGLTETQRAGPPSAAPRLLRALRIVHPFPTLLNVAATAALAFVAARGAPMEGLRRCS
jgi:hypothetical protein